MYTLNIVDLDNVLHIGTKAGKMGEFNVKSFPTGGIYQTLRIIKDTQSLTRPDENKIIFVYDKHANYRKSLYPEYKEKRKDYKTQVDLVKDKAVRLQKMFLIEQLTKAGFMVLGKDYFEADDMMFNVVLSLIYRPEQPLNNGLQVVLHSSDEDWLGTLGLAPNIFFKCTNNNSEKLSSVKSYHDFCVTYNDKPEYLYMVKAVYGDTSDNYKGFMNPKIFDKPEIANCDNSNYWNYYYWEEIFKRDYAGSGEILNNMLLNLRLAFPMYDPETFGKDYLSELWNNPLNVEHILKMLELLRINIFEKQFGKLRPFDGESLRQLDTLKNQFKAEYEEVFEYYSKREYSPKATTTEVDNVFNKYGNIKL